jgi:hypothetical protein
MRALGSIAAALALGLLAFIASPAQAAIHGVDWEASGVATDGSDAVAITVRWNGCLGCFLGVYTVELTGLEGTSTHSFNGYLSLLERNILGSNMAILYATGGSTTPGVAFTIAAGVQAGTTIISPGPKVISNLHVGTYEGLQFVVANPIDTYQFG